MPAQKRHKTKYAGVHFVESISPSGGVERIYYIRYRKAGKITEEKAGKQFQDDMTPARAAKLRGLRIDGQQLSNVEKRAVQESIKKAEAGKWSIDKLWNEYQSHKTISKGLRTDQVRYDLYLKPKFGDKEPKDIVQLEIDRIRISLLKNKSPQTVKHVLALLKRIINFGTNKGLCQGLGFKIEMPRVDNQKTEFLTDLELERLLKALDESDNIQVAAMMKMALFTGMRRGELFKLQWKDIDFERGFIDIRDPKGGQSQKIPMNDAAAELLKNHPKTESKYVFPGLGGNRRVSMQQAVHKIMDAAGLPKGFRPMHGLRHTFAGLLASSGQVDLYTLQKLMTHKDSKMTARYSHLRDESLKRAANIAGDIISKAANGKANVVDMTRITKGE